MGTSLSELRLEQIGSESWAICASYSPCGQQDRGERKAHGERRRDCSQDAGIEEISVTGAATLVWEMGMKICL